MTLCSFSLIPLAACALSAAVAAQSGAVNPPVQGPATDPATFSFGTQSTSDLIAPDAAALVAGGGSIFDWLNVVNAPLTLNEAMTTMPVENGGYANADLGTIVEVKFSGGVVNGPGPDIAIVESQYDDGEYAISSSYDGFAASVTANTAGAPVRVSTAY